MYISFPPTIRVRIRVNVIRLGLEIGVRVRLGFRAKIWVLG